MAEVFYSGEQTGRVTVRQGETKRVLDPRFDLRKYSPSGFTWGEGDSKSAQLALALLADALQSDARAVQLHHHFGRRVVCIFPERWTITRSRVLAHVNVIEQQVSE